MAIWTKYLSFPCSTLSRGYGSRPQLRRGVEQSRYVRMEDGSFVARGASSDTGSARNTFRYEPDDFLHVAGEGVVRQGACPSSNIVRVTAFDAK